MAEQTFKSPGFFQREIEVISRPRITNNSTPVGIVGPAEKGPAFVPTKISSESEFYRIFGKSTKNMYSGHAVNEYFRNNPRGSIRFCRVLGTGLSSFSSTSDLSAGFKLEATSIANSNRKMGTMHFIAANHTLNNAEHLTSGMFTDNDSHTTVMDSDITDGLVAGADPNVQVIRAMIITRKDLTLRLMNISDSLQTDDHVACESSKFKLVLTDSLGTTHSSYLISLDPSDQDYISNVLNTDSFSLNDKGHYLFADFPVDREIADVGSNKVAVLTGNDDHIESFGNFQKRYSAAKTTMFISQPFGKKEYELFRFESLDDGSSLESRYKISILGLRASLENNYKYGTFSVQLRDLHDTDENPVVYESWSNLSLDTQSDNYIAKVIGDSKVRLSLDVDSEEEKRLVREGNYPNQSTRIRVVMSDDVENRIIPEIALPFGFKGVPALKSVVGLKDGQDNASLQDSLMLAQDSTGEIFDAGTVDQSDKLGFSLLPPMPYRFKVTKGSMLDNSGSFFQTKTGQVIVNNVKQNSENVSTQLFWGLMNTRINNIENPNVPKNQNDFNKTVLNLTKSIALDEKVLYKGVEADKFNNNKFSLAKVALAPGKSNVKDLEGSVLDVFLEAVYIRNADVSVESIYDSNTNMIKMGGTEDPLTRDDDNRMSLAKLLSEDPFVFNKYNLMAKFTAPFYGGFDGVNILDRDDFYLTDLSASTEQGVGHAALGGYSSAISSTEGDSPMQGSLLNNNTIVSYKNAIRLLTDPILSDVNVLVVPGIRESLITDYAADRTKAYGKAIFLMDIEHFTSDSQRIYTDTLGNSTGVADPNVTSAKFLEREINSSYVATYFPDVNILDSGDSELGRITNQRTLKVPSSVVALGALGITDAQLRPWFAPAGFSRGALSSVRSLDTRLTTADRDNLYESRINPIANFPNGQFVIFGQKTTQIARTALDRVNVRRLMIQIKRSIEVIAQNLLFEQNNEGTRSRFITAATNILQQIQVGQGIEGYRVIMDDSNNPKDDPDFKNKLNGTIVVVPTRAVEFIAVDFVITNSGVEFTA